MADFEYDLFVIGAGSGGVRAARVSAGLGARVAIAEERYLGGTCVNVGCVPKKLLVYAASFREAFDDAVGFGWGSVTPPFDWQRLIANKDNEITRLQGIYQQLLQDAGVTLVNGRATVLDPHTVAVGEHRYRTQTILIATGGWPSVPDLPGKEYIITSNEAFFLDTLPNSIVIVGGGYIAVEFAGIFNGLGVKTDLVYRGDLFLRGFDEDLRTFLAEEMRKKDLQLHFNSSVVAIEQSGPGYSALLANGETINADLMMYATGRKPNSQNLGLDTLGVDLTKTGAVITNEHFQSSVPSIYALGDVTDRVNLTPVAIAEGMVLASHLFGDGKQGIDYDNIPTAVFSQPNLASVGLTEDQARKDHSKVDVYKSAFRPMKHSLSGRNEKTLMKLVVDGVSDRVLGAHMIGPDAAEIIQGLAIAIRAGATKAVFDSTIGIHPSAAEEFVTLRNNTLK